MAWWKLVVTGKNELTEDDEAHIADLVRQGYIEGELNDEEDL